MARGRVPHPGDVTSVRPTFDSFVAHFPDRSGPEDPRHFGVLVWIFISQEGVPGVDRFDAWVCTPSWISGTFDPASPADSGYWVTGSSQILSSVIVMSEWSEEELIRVVTELCNDTAGASWRAVGNRLSRQLLWELDESYDRDEDARG